MIKAMMTGALYLRHRVGFSPAYTTAEPRGSLRSSGSTTARVDDAVVSSYSSCARFETGSGSATTASSGRGFAIASAYCDWRKRLTGGPPFGPTPPVPDVACSSGLALPLAAWPAVPWSAML